MCNLTRCIAARPQALRAELTVHREYTPVSAALTVRHTLQSICTQAALRMRCSETLSAAQQRSDGWVCSRRRCGASRLSCSSIALPRYVARAVRRSALFVACCRMHVACCTVHVACCTAHVAAEIRRLTAMPRIAEQHTLCLAFYGAADVHSPCAVTARGMTDSHGPLPYSAYSAARQCNAVLWPCDGDAMRTCR